MVRESWDVFTKRVLVEKRISGITYKNLGGPRSPLPTSMLERLKHCSISYTCVCTL